MKKIMFITTTDAEYGFRLGGVLQQVASAEDVGRKLQDVCDDPDYGLVVIDEPLLQAIDEDTIQSIERQWDGVLLTLPSHEATREEIEAYMASLLRKTIGYHIKLNV